MMIEVASFRRGEEKMPDKWAYGKTQFQQPRTRKKVVNDKTKDGGMKVIGNSFERVRNNIKDTSMIRLATLLWLSGLTNICVLRRSNGREGA